MSASCFLRRRKKLLATLKESYFLLVGTYWYEFELSEELCRFKEDTDACIKLPLLGKHFALLKKSFKWIRLFKRILSSLNQGCSRASRAVGLCSGSWFSNLKSRLCPFSLTCTTYFFLVDKSHFSLWRSTSFLELPPNRYLPVNKLKRTDPKLKISALYEYPLPPGLKISGET